MTLFIIDVLWRGQIILYWHVTYVNAWMHLKIKYNFYYKNSNN